MFENQYNPALYASTEWFCFPPGTYSLLNDVYVNGEGTSPGISVDRCMNMQRHLPDFDTSNCVTDDTEFMSTKNKIWVNLKAVNQYFNPEEYLQTGQMGYKVGDPLLGVFPTNPATECSTVQLLVEKVSIDYWTNQIFQVNSFP